MKKGLADFQGDFEYPPYPYVPGRSPKYSDTDFAFDDIKASVTPGLRPEQLGETLAFKAGCAFYDRGFYWECYQVLDPVWMQTEDPSPERDLVLALIQLANARMKLASGRPHAAWRLCDMVEAHLSRCPKDRAVLGLRVAALVEENRTTRDLAKSRM